MNLALKSAFRITTCVLQTVGGFAYFYLLIFLGSLLAGAGHGTYVLFDYAGGVGVVGWWSACYWSIFGLFFAFRKYRWFALAGLAQLIVPYLFVGFHMVEGKYNDDSFSLDAFLLITILVFVFTQAWAAFYLVRSIRRTKRNVGWSEVS